MLVIFPSDEAPEAAAEAAVEAAAEAALDVAVDAEDEPHAAIASAMIDASATQNTFFISDSSPFFIKKYFFILAL
jgi:hypothetical protein